MGANGRILLHWMDVLRANKLDLRVLEAVLAREVLDLGQEQVLKFLQGHLAGEVEEQAE